MRKFHNFFIITIVSGIICLSACSNVLASPKNRIISLTPASTEILFALGLRDEIIGVSSFCDWPAEAKNKEKIGSFSSPNIEKIILLKPDLILLTGMEQKYLNIRLSNLGIDYIVVYPSNINELMACIKEIGRATGMEKKAKVLVGDIRRTIRSIRKRVSRIPEEKKPRVYLEIWHDPIMSPGSKSFVSDMIETAGGRNITKDLKRSYSIIDPEVIIYRNPNIIILTYMKTGNWIRNNFTKRIGWKDIDAVKDNKIFADIDSDLVLRPGSRVKEGLLELYKRFYEN